MSAEIIRAILDDEQITVDALVTNAHADTLAVELAAAFDRAGYVIKPKPKPRAAAAPVEVFAPNTGDPAVDAFMRRKHDPKYKPLPLPKGPSLPALRPLAEVLAEAIAIAKQRGWPGTYTGNFAAPKTRRSR